MSSCVNSNPRSGARLVAQAADDLVVAVLPAHHQELLQLLRRLRQRVERARPQPRGHEEVAGALRGRAREDRRLDLEEPERRGTRASRGRCARDREHLRHLGPPQVEVAVAQAQVLGASMRSSIGNGGVSASEVQTSERVARHLDVAGRRGRGSACPRGARAPRRSTRARRLRAEPLGGCVGLGRFLRMEHDLHGALAVAQVDEGDAAVSRRRRPSRRASPARPRGRARSSPHA